MSVLGTVAVANRVLAVLVTVRWPYAIHRQRAWMEGCAGHWCPLAAACGMHHASLQVQMASAAQAYVVPVCRPALLGYVRLKWSHPAASALPCSLVCMVVHALNHTHGTGSSRLEQAYQPSCAAGKALRAAWQAGSTPGQPGQPGNKQCLPSRWGPQQHWGHTVAMHGST